MITSVDVNERNQKHKNLVKSLSVILVKEKQKEPELNRDMVHVVKHVDDELKPR